MNKFNTFLFCALASAGSVMSQTTVYTDPVGFVTISIPAASDAILSVPMQRPAVFMGVVSSISGNQVTLNSAPTLPAGTTYALYIASGTKEGMTCRINGAPSGAVVTVVPDTGDDLTGIVTGANGDKVRVMPYWTPASLFPGTVPIGTQIQIFGSAQTGVNLSADNAYVHGGSGIWEDALTSADASNSPLAFGSSFVLRNVGGSAISVACVGDVPTKKHRLKLATKAANTPQDIRFGYGSPIAETLSNMGLTGNEGDQLFGFNNAASGYNKSASQLLVWESGQWVDQISGNPVPNFQFTPGYGYLFRKAATPSATVYVWSDLPSYLPLQ